MAQLAEMIGKRIKEIRKHKGLRQEDMESLGLSYKYFQRIEQGRANVTLATLEKVAEALQISAGELLSLPFTDDAEANELASSVGRIIGKDDTAKIRKLNTFIRDIL